MNDVPMSGPVNSVLRDPEDFGSREFWKNASSVAMRRWAETTDALTEARAMLDWAETLLCNSRAEEGCNPQEWCEAVRDWREQKNGGHRR